MCIAVEPKRPINRQKLLDQLFIASSTLNTDLKEADKLLSNYHLSVERKRNSGIFIRGNEYDKRKCLLKLGHLEIHQEQGGMGCEETFRQDIETVLVSVLLKHHFHISETLFQNLIVHIEMSIKRMYNGFYIGSEEFEGIEDFDSEMEVSAEIFHRLAERSYFKNLARRNY